MRRGLRRRRQREKRCSSSRIGQIRFVRRLPKVQGMFYVEPRRLGILAVRRQNVIVRRSNGRKGKECVRFLNHLAAGGSAYVREKMTWVMPYGRILIVTVVYVEGLRPDLPGQSKVSESGNHLLQAMSRIKQFDSRSPGCDKKKQQEMAPTQRCRPCRPNFENWRSAFGAKNRRK